MLLETIKDFMICGFLLWHCNLVLCYMDILRGLVRQQTIPTERPPLVGEVSANFSG
jgi:hypothetical protein